MSKRTNEELIQIITIDKTDYNLEALKAAELEVEKREIDINAIETTKEKLVVEKNNLEEVDRAIVNSWVRFLNFIIDFVAIVVLFLIVSSLIGPVIQAIDQALFRITYFVLIYGVFVGYYAIMEIKFQKTLGKFITKTKVVRNDGEKPKNRDIIIRTFCRAVPFDRVSFFFTRTGFHDSLSKTKVVKDILE